jgi:hypothetical protein
MVILTALLLAADIISMGLILMSAYIYLRNRFFDVNVCPV